MKQCLQGPAGRGVCATAELFRHQCGYDSSREVVLVGKARDGQAMRLGFVAGGDTSTFALPAALTAGANSIRFQARPVRRSGEAVTSEPFGVGGAEISWSIPPQ